MKIKNLATIGLAALLTLTSCGEKDKKEEISSNKIPDLIGVWSPGEQQKETAVVKGYYQFTEGNKFTLHVRCIFDDGPHLHSNAHFYYSQNEPKGPITSLTGKKFGDLYLDPETNTEFSCGGRLSPMVNKPYILKEVDGKTQITFDGKVMNKADLKEKLVRKDPDETSQNINSFVDIKATVTKK